MDKQKLESALEIFIDKYIEMVGIPQALTLLIEDANFTKSDLLEIGFSEESINEYFE